MAKDWDYARLAHSVKKLGGPEKYLKVIKEHSFNSGRKRQAMIDGGIVLGSGIVYYLYKAYEQHKEKKTISTEQVAEAEQSFIEKMNEILEENPINTEENEEC